MKVKSRLRWGPQVAGGGRAVACLPGRLRERERSQPRREKWDVLRNRAEKTERKNGKSQLRPLTSAIERLGLELVLLGY